MASPRMFLSFCIVLSLLLAIASTTSAHGRPSVNASGHASSTLSREGDDGFVPPSPAYGYYQETGPDDLDWLSGQLPVFAEYDLILFLGIPDTMIGDPGLLEVLREAERLEVEVRVWVLLPYEIGYWPNEDNVVRFADSALGFAEWLRAEGLPIDWIVVDMEMSINELGMLEELVMEGAYLEAALRLLGNLNPAQFEAASQLYQEMVDDLHALGFYAMVVTYPMVLDDMDDGDTALQDLLDIPVSTVAWDEVSTMVYTPTYEAMLGMDFGPDLVYSYALSTAEKFGTAASIALQVTSDTLDPQQLEAEVAAAKAAGVDRIQVYAYHTCYGRPDEELWHQAFYAEAQRPGPEAATRLIRFLVHLADRIL